MIFNKSCQIDAATGDDITRQSLTSAYLNVGAKMLEATNGHLGVRLPVTVEPGDVSGYVTDDAIKAARKAAGKGSEASIHANGSLAVPNGPTFPRPDYGRFPDLASVMPAYKAGDAGTVTVHFSPSLLADLCKAIGATTRTGMIGFTFKLPETEGRYKGRCLDPIVISTSESSAQAVLMPARG
jgi:hypothetical protein